jgi:serpin B
VDLKLGSGGICNAFALALYRQLSLARGNLACSPISVLAALAMTHAGARGATAAQMRLALRISLPDASFHAVFGSLLRQIVGAAQGAQELSLANSLWSCVGAPVLPQYASQIMRDYGGELHCCDFEKPDAARARINEWVEAQTGKQIRGLIPAGCPGPLTRLLVINVACFRALWETPFASHKTADAPFFLEDGRSVTVPMMHSRANLVCGQGPGFRFVNLAYQGGRMSMLVLLPDHGERLKCLEDSLTEPLIASCLRAKSALEVELYLPRFTVKSGSIELKDALEGLGMVSAFDRLEADFSGINDCRPPDAHALHVDRILHEASVAVTEEGTEARAANSLMFERLGLYPDTPEFRVDHPFLFAICHRASGATVFLGRVLNPEASRPPPRPSPA